MLVEELLLRIQTTPDCRVDAPSGFPVIKPEHRLPEDVRAFYHLCGGLSLAEHSSYPVRIGPPTRCVLANPVILGEERARKVLRGQGKDISWSWYIVADYYDGNYLTVDLDPERLGRYYDSFHETRG